MVLPCASGARRRQKVCDLGFEHGRICSSDVFGVNAPIASYQECYWQSKNASIELTQLGASECDRVVHVEVTIELTDRVRTVVHGNSDDLKARLPVLILKLDESWDFLAAGATPSCPEVEQDQLPAVACQIEILVIDSVYGKIWGERAGAGRQFFRHSAMLMTIRECETQHQASRD
jgi:hypothetical protein